VVLHKGNPRHIRFDRFTDEGIADWFESVQRQNGPFVILERVWARPMNGARHAFGQGCNYGFLRGVFAVLDIKPADPTPSQWQKDLEIPPRKKGARKVNSRTKKEWVEGEETNEDFKKRLWAIAVQWSKIKGMERELADAYLIAEWGRRQHQAAQGIKK